MRTIAVLGCVLLTGAAFIACGDDPAAAKGAALRLYHGAPPVVPHGLDEIGRRNCQSCHARGYARSNGRRAPITPHPTRSNCRQCHVEGVVRSVFRENEFATKTVDRGRLRVLYAKANPLGPPYIPHRLQDRGRCAKCHLSEVPTSAPRPRHGARSNCLQCHVPLDFGAERFAAKP